MMKTLMGRFAGLAVLFMILGSGCAPAPSATTENKQVRHDQLYLCDCGEGCTCNTVVTAPGQCACGKELKGYHVVKIEGDEALLCTCGETCVCAIDPKDESKCGCGQPVKRVSLKGTGVYFCNCGGACACNTLAGKPGTCVCGMPLKKAN